MKKKQRKLFDVNGQSHWAVLSSHTLSERYNFNFDEINISGREVNDRKRKILEEIRIFSNFDFVNFETDTAKAKNSYANLLRENDDYFC